MSELIELNPSHPQKEQLNLITAYLHQGALIAYPTDSGYALGCALNQQGALERIRAIRNLPPQHNFTLICQDIAEISHYAKLNNTQFKLIKRLTPGGYTFILPASREVPAPVLSKQATVGVRIPDHPIPLLIAETLGAPLLTSTLILPDMHTPLIYREDVVDHVGNAVDLIIDAGYSGFESTSVLDLTGPYPVILRKGSGDISAFE